MKRGILIRITAFLLALVLVWTESVPVLVAGQEVSASEAEALFSEQKSDSSEEKETLPEQNVFVPEEDDRTAAAKADDAEVTGEGNIEEFSESVSEAEAEEPVQEPEDETEAEEPVYDVAETEGGYLVSVKNPSLEESITEVKTAVWSDNGWQDDLRWYRTTFDAETNDGSQVISLTAHKDYGLYYFDTYAVLESGKSVFLFSRKVTVPKPAAESVSASYDTGSGDFTITVRGAVSIKGVTRVQAPTWSKVNGQDDLIWYDAEAKEDGSYVVTGNIRSHKYSQGLYYADVYLTDGSGARTYIGGTTMEMSASRGEVLIDESADMILYHVTVQNFVIPGGAAKVRVAAWSKTNGQDDLVWYEAKKTGENVYETDIDIRNHKTAGAYYVDVYGTSNGGTSVYLGGNYSINVTPAAKQTITIEEGTTSGTFVANLTTEYATGGVEKVLLPVWTKADHSDIVWYNAEKVADNQYKVVVDIRKHKGNTGTFYLDSYTTVGNGIQVYSSGITYYYRPSNLLLVLNDAGVGKRRILLIGADAGVSKVTFPTWSKTNGQDDLVWYSGRKNANGDWEALVETKNHKSYGTFFTDAYADGKFAASSTYEIDKSEFLKNGWYYENGYKLYYKDGVLQKDVYDLIPATRTFVAKVNRTTCTVTIYAKDGTNGYIIPVIAFACSVGLPATPTPVGTFYTSEKYRWKELMGPSYGQYATRIVGGVLFHSVAGYNKTSYNLPAAEYNLLGQPASHGCVRLNVRDAKWIYDHCNLGMKVIIYDSADPGPLGKPKTIWIPGSQNWDPTDPAIQ